MANTKKLQLNKETIRNLSDESLEQVAGGKQKGDSNLISACETLCVGAGCVDSVVCTAIKGHCH